MSPVENGSSPNDEGDAPANFDDVNPVGTPVDPKASYLIVAWDLDTTGRRLVDEICQIGGYFHSHSPQKEGEKEKEEKPADNVFSQYVMPYKNPNPGARRSFGIRVVNIGRYRMLKDMESGKILKTKSEVSALQDFIDWLKRSAEKAGKDGVLLLCHEPTRKVLIPLLLEALYKYHLMDSFKATVKGFVNGIFIVKKFGDRQKITSLSLRSLCKTVLADTNPTTASASDRCKVLVQIANSLVGQEDVSAKVASVTITVASEEEELKQLKGMLGTQGTLRPIFESRLRQKRSVREKAMALRKQVAENGLDYDALSKIYKEQKTEVNEVLSGKLKEATKEDIDELVTLLKNHFDENEGASKEGETVSEIKEERKGKKKAGRGTKSTPKAKNDDEAKADDEPEKKEEVEAN